MLAEAANEQEKHAGADEHGGKLSEEIRLVGKLYIRASCAKLHVNRDPRPSADGSTKWDGKLHRQRGSEGNAVADLKKAEHGSSPNRGERKIRKKYLQDPQDGGKEEHEGADEKHAFCAVEYRARETGENTFFILFLRRSEKEIFLLFSAKVKSCADADDGGGEQLRDQKQKSEFCRAEQRSAHRTHQKAGAWIVDKHRQLLKLSFADPSLLIKRNGTSLPHGKAAKKTEKNGGCSLLGHSENKGDGRCKKSSRKRGCPRCYKKLGEHHEWK